MRSVPIIFIFSPRSYQQEEDFATQTFNREMLRHFTVEDVKSCMGEAVDLLASVAIPDELRPALVDRLLFRTLLLELLQSNAVAAPPPPQTGFVQRMWQTTDAGEPVSDAFSTKLQRRLASSLPPRPMVSVARHEAFEFFDRMLQETSGAFELLNIAFSGDMVTAYWLFMSQVPQPSVYVRALLQSYLHINGKLLDRFTDKECVIEDLRHLTLPASILLDPANSLVENPVDDRFRMASQINQFVLRIAPSFVNLLRSFCQNRCRIRRILCHGALEWDSIQADAEDMDGTLQTLVNEKPISYPEGEGETFSYPLSSWIYHYKLLQLRYTVQLGFEMSVYAPHEHASMYWYLSHLSSLHLSHLERISFFISAQTQTGTESINMEKDDALKWLYKQFSVLKATDTLACALHRLYILLQRHGHFAKVHPAYASEELRFELRMRPFQHLSIPEPLTFEQMDGLSNLSSLSDREILEQASKLCVAAKKAWEEVLKQTWNFKPVLEDNDSRSPIEFEWTKDVRNCLKACIGTSIAVSTLANLYQQGVKSEILSGVFQKLKVVVPQPEALDRFHSWWAVPKIAP